MKKSLIIALFCLPLLAWADDKTKVKFFKGVLKEDLKEVKSAAKAEGKLILLDFTASWCMPCRWMEENTFNDPTLAEYMDKNYIAVKVDIDDIEGFALKERHNVEVLPTMIVFDPSGKVVGRVAESLGAKKMVEKLSAFRLTRPTLVPNPEPTKPVAKPVNVVKPVQPAGNSAAAPKKDVKKPTNVTYSPGLGMYKIDISRKIEAGYSIQVCSLSQYDNVVKKFEELKSAYEKPVLINIENVNGKPVYKILIGEFKKKEDAEKFKKDKKIDGFIKELVASK